MTREILPGQYPERAKKSTNNSTAKVKTFFTKTVGKLTFPIYNHKRESDRANKHIEWTRQKHLLLTTLAILTDLGFNAATIILLVSGNLWETAILKSAHIIGAEILPQPITNLKNKIVNKRS